MRAAVNPVGHGVPQDKNFTKVLLAKNEKMLPKEGRETLFTATRKNIQRNWCEFPKKVTQQISEGVVS